MTGENNGFLMTNEIEFGIAVLIIVFNNFVIYHFTPAGDAAGGFFFADMALSL